MEDVTVRMRSKSRQRERLYTTTTVSIIIAMILTLLGIAFSGYMASSPFEVLLYLLASLFVIYAALYTHLTYIIPLMEDLLGRYKTYNWETDDDVIKRIGRKDGTL